MKYTFEERDIICGNFVIRQDNETIFTLCMIGFTADHSHHENVYNIVSLSDGMQYLSVIDKNELVKSLNAHGFKPINRAEAANIIKSHYISKL